MNHAKNGHILAVVGGAQEHTMETLPEGGGPYMVHSAQARTYINIVNIFLWLTMNMQIKVHNVVGHTVPTYTMVVHNVALYQSGRAQHF